MARIFRILVPAKDLATSRRFYQSLLGTPGRDIAEGRVYFDVGDVVLGVLDRSADPNLERSRPTEAIYFATDDLAGLHARARALGCLSSEFLHGDPSDPMGEIVVRPWGERSFYVEDPAGNPLCFVDQSTLFTGTPAQVERLRHASAHDED